MPLEHSPYHIRMSIAGCLLFLALMVSFTRHEE
jgi:hypothetical protein